MKKRRKVIQPLSDDQIFRVLVSARRPVGIDELVNIFRKGKPNRRELLRLLGTLIAKGRVTELKNKRFGVTKEMDLVSGTTATEGYIYIQSINLSGIERLAVDNHSVN